MKVRLAAALAIFFAAQTGKAFAYACNNNYYVNSSGHFVHRGAPEAHGGMP